MSFEGEYRLQDYSVKATRLLVHIMRILEHLQFHVQLVHYILLDLN